ncbi:MAG: flagellar hook-length control protein FliK [Cellulosilyticaceae bacterium]
MNLVLMPGVGTPSPTRQQGHATEVKDKKNTEQPTFKKVMDDQQKPIEKKDSIVHKDKTQQVKVKNKESLLNQPIEGQKKLTNTADLEMLMSQLGAEFMTLLAEAMNVPVTEVEHVLGQLECEPIELMDLEVLKQVVTACVGEEAFGLQGDASMMRKITLAWEQVQQITQQTFEETPDLLVFVQEQLADQQEKAVSEEPQGTIQQVTQQGKVAQMGSDNAEEVAPIMESLLEKLQPKVQSQEKTLDSGQLEAVATEFQHIGMHLPIQDLLEAQTARMWQQTTKETTGMMHTEHAPINKQILERVDFYSLKDGNEIAIELSPKELGKLSLKVSEHNGIVTTTIKVENEKTKEMLLQHLESLKESLEAQGLTVGSFQVDIKENPHQNEMSKQKQKSSKRIQEIIDQQLAELTAEDGVDQMIQTSSTIEVDIKA